MHRQRHIGLVQAAAFIGSGRRLTAAGRVVQMNDTKKLKLECSLFTPEAEAACRGVGMPLVIYCHCNSGSRRDSEETLHLLMPAGIRVFALDFAVRAKLPRQCSHCVPALLAFGQLPVGSKYSTALGQLLQKNPLRDRLNLCAAGCCEHALNACHADRHLLDQALQALSLARQCRVACEQSPAPFPRPTLRHRAAGTFLGTLRSAAQGLKGGAYEKAWCRARGGLEGIM